MGTCLFLTPWLYPTNPQGGSGNLLLTWADEPVNPHLPSPSKRILSLPAQLQQHEPLWSMQLLRNSPALYVDAGIQQDRVRWPESPPPFSTLLLLRAAQRCVRCCSLLGAATLSGLLMTDLHLITISCLRAAICSSCWTNPANRLMSRRSSLRGLVMLSHH